MPFQPIESSFPVPPLLINPATPELHAEMLRFSPPLLKVHLSSSILSFPSGPPSFLTKAAPVGSSWTVKSWQRIDLKDGSILELLIVPSHPSSSGTSVNTSSSSSFSASSFSSATSSKLHKLQGKQGFYYPLAFPEYNIVQMQAFIDNCLTPADLMRMGRINVARDGFDFVCLVQALKTVEAEYQYIYETSYLSNVGLYKSLALLPSSTSPTHQPCVLKPTAYPAQADAAQKKLMSLAKRLCTHLKITSVGVGPPKTVSRAVSKASSKYAGDITRVLDWCRAVIVCPNPSVLLSALLLIRSRCSSTLVRLKTDSLIGEALPGGYRHAVVNFDLGGHVGELCLTTEEMWSVCKTKGSRHYFHCMDLGSDSLRNVDSIILGVGSEERGDMIQDVEGRFGKLLESDGNWTEYQTNVVMALTRLLIHSGFDRWASLNLRKILNHYELVDKSASNPNVNEVKKILVRCLERMGNHEEAEDISLEVLDMEEKAKVEVHCVSRVANVSVDTFKEMVTESRLTVAQKVQDGQDSTITREYKFLAEEGLEFRRELGRTFPFLCIDEKTGLETRGPGKNKVGH